MCSRESIRLVLDSLAQAAAGNRESLETLMLGSVCAGFVINHTGTIMVHGMGYPLTINYGLHHGTANALLLPYVLGFLARNGYGEEIKALGETLSPGTIRALARAAGLPTTLEEIGVKEEDLDRLAEEAALGCERSFRNMKRAFPTGDLRKVLGRAWRGAPD